MWQSFHKRGYMLGDHFVAISYCTPVIARLDQHLPLNINSKPFAAKDDTDEDVTIHFQGYWWFDSGVNLHSCWNLQSVWA